MATTFNLTSLVGHDLNDIANVRRKSVLQNQIQDDYEDDPVLSSVPFYKRIRGREGAWPPKNKQVSTKEKIPVYACVQINEVTTIDTKTNTFGIMCTVYLIFDCNFRKVTNRLKEEYEEEIGSPLEDERKLKLAQWEEIMENAFEDEGCPYKVEDEEYEPCKEEIEWPESLELFNSLSCDQVEDEKITILEIRSDENGDYSSGTVMMEVMDGLFDCKEYQELEFFPFDAQDLSLDFQLTSRTDMDRFDLRLHTVEMYYPCVQMVEWVMYPPECDRKGTAKTSVRLRAVRKSKYYITNVVVMMAVLCAVCVAAWGIDVGDIADRLSVTLTMMLTAVAFKLIVGEQLPKVSYNTFLDIYLIYTMAFMFGVSVYFCIAPHVIAPDNEDKQADLDLYGGCGTFLSIFVFFNIYWFYGAWAIIQEIMKSLPPPVALEKGQEYISWRWQKVPFRTFENKLTQDERAGIVSPGATQKQPENLDRLSSYQAGVNESEENEGNGDDLAMAEEFEEVEMPKRTPSTTGGTEKQL